jgi:hypothetical protein
LPALARACFDNPFRIAIGVYLTESEDGGDKSIFSSNNYLGLQSRNFIISSLLNRLKVSAPVTCFSDDAGDSVGEDG